MKAPSSRVVIKQSGNSGTRAEVFWLIAADCIPQKFSVNGAAGKDPLSPDNDPR